MKRKKLKREQKFLIKFPVTTQMNCVIYLGLLWPWRGGRESGM